MNYEYYVNNKLVSYTLFKHYLAKSIRHKTNFTITNKELNNKLYGLINHLKVSSATLTTKDKMTYHIV